MTITPFGQIFITLGLTILVARPAWLLPLLIVSAVLQAFAVAIIGPAIPSVGLGITPWLFTCFLICIHLIAIIGNNRGIKLEVSRSVKLLFWGWMILIGWCVVTAFTLPVFFQGTPVYPFNWTGFDGPLQPLISSRTNAIQAANSIIIGIMLLYVLQQDKDSNVNSRLISGFTAAVLIVFSINLYQKFEALESILDPSNILHKSLNPSYFHDVMDAERKSWPFSEPSYASVWYSGVSLGGLSIYLFASRSIAGLAFLGVGLFGLLISRGGSGIAGFGLSLLVLSIGLSVVIFQDKVLRKYVLNRLFILVFLITVMAFLYESVRGDWPNLHDIYLSIQSIVKDRISGPIYNRGNSNLNALIVTQSTWGLGGGLGTNRASSYPLSMMSNIGIPGLALFLLLLAYQLYLLVFKSTNRSTLAALIFGGTIGTYCGMMIGIPDLFLPAWWIWLIAGFLLCAIESPPSVTIVVASLKPGTLGAAMKEISGTLRTIEHDH